MKILIIALILVVSNLSCAYLSDRAGDRKPRSFKAGSKPGATQVVLLGTGTPNAEPEHSGPAVAIVVNGTPYVVDCGPGVVRRAAAASEAGVAGLEVEKLCRIFITHLHSDHTAGYPDFIFTPWVLERKEPIEAFGPPGLKAMTGHILKAYDEDIQVRINGPEHASPIGVTVNVHEIDSGLIYEDENVRVKAFRVIHGTWEHAFGFRFETADRTIVVSGDTIPCRELVENATGCDLLIHEVYSKDAFERRPPMWQQYHKASHTSTEELAEIAREAKPRLLVLYHQLRWGISDEDLVDEVREGYDGEVVSGRDLDLFH